MIKSFLLPLIIVFSTISIQAQKLSNERSVDKFIKNQVNQKNIAGAVVLISRKGETIMHTAYGQQDIEDKVKMTTSSIFRIYSMTKPITSLATMMLVDRDSITLDDPIEMYIPELKNLMVLEKKTIQVLKNKKIHDSRNEVKPTKGKIVVFKNEIKQYEIRSDGFGGITNSRNDFL